MFFDHPQRKVGCNHNDRSYLLEPERAKQAAQQRVANVNQREPHGNANCQAASNFPSVELGGWLAGKHLDALGAQFFKVLLDLRGRLVVLDRLGRQRFEELGSSWRVQAFEHNGDVVTERRLYHQTTTRMAIHPARDIIFAPVNRKVLHAGFGLRIRLF